MSVDGRLVTLMTHPEIVSLIRAGAAELRLGVERGDHVVPNIKEAFPVTAEMELDQVRRHFGYLSQQGTTPCRADD